MTPKRMRGIIWLPPECRPARSLPLSPGAMSSAMPEPGIEDIAQAVADKVQAQHRHADGRAAEHHAPGGDHEVLLAIVGDVSPRGRRWWDPEPEEAQGGLHEYRGADVEREGDDQRREHVGQDVAAHDPDHRAAERAGRLHELHVTHPEHLAADDTGDPGPD